MSVETLKYLLDDRTLMVPLTVEQYHQMIDGGILPESSPIELLDGYLIHKDRSQTGKNPMTVGHHHAWVISQLTAYLSSLPSLNCHVRIQQPVTIPPDSEPDPDLTIVRGTPDDFRDAHPQAADVVCVIEVADSSVRRDRTTKLRIYADAGILRYVLISLFDGTVEDYREPQPGTGRYSEMTVLRRGDVLNLGSTEFGEIPIPVASVLP